MYVFKSFTPLFPYLFFSSLSFTLFQTPVVSEALPEIFLFYINKKDDDHITKIVFTFSAPTLVFDPVEHWDKYHSGVGSVWAPHSEGQKCIVQMLINCYFIFQNVFVCVLFQHHVFQAWRTSDSPVYLFKLINLIGFLCGLMGFSYLGDRMPTNWANSALIKFYNCVFGFIRWKITMLSLYASGSIWWKDTYVMVVCIR